jgi:hypothetical protein
LLAKRHAYLAKPRSRWSAVFAFPPSILLACAYADCCIRDWNVILADRDDRHIATSIPATVGRVLHAPAVRALNQTYWTAAENSPSRLGWRA